MNKYRIESNAGVVLGEYEGNTKEEAIRAMNADAGESDLDRDDNLIVIEVEAEEYFEVAITPHHSGFGMWQVGECGEAWADAQDLINEIAATGDLYELGEDDLPECVEDIRGHIYNQPSRVFALVNGEDIRYLGVVAK